MAHLIEDAAEIISLHALATLALRRLEPRSRSVSESFMSEILQTMAPQRSVVPVRAYLESRETELAAMLEQPASSGVSFARRHAEMMDVLLRMLFEATSAGHVETLLLGAVGSYGRRLLGYKSDLDVCFVTSGQTEALSPFIDAILYPLWDAGLSVGHQVIHLSEVVQDAARDLPTATELLDFRPLAGCEALGGMLRECLRSSVFSECKIADFIARLEQHAASRHQRFGESVYLLEPDVKNGTGGLRDLDYALWAARARFGTGELSELAALGIITMQRLEEVQRAFDFLWTVRNQLHQLAGRRVDRLTFAGQETLARQLGYGERAPCAPGASEVQVTGAMVEAFMSDYYRHARVIARARDQIIGHAKRRSDATKPVETQLGGGFVACEGGIALADPSVLSRDPALAMRLYAAALERDLPVLARSRDAVAQAAADPDFGADLRESREAAYLFVELVATSRKGPFRAGTILTELHDVGLLLAMIPEFAPVVGRVHHDLYHVYTVDVHSVAAVDRLHALKRGDLVSEFPLASRLAAETTRPSMLVLATLLHDVGKAIGGHNHAQRGAEMARPILERLGLEAEDVDDACHLILKHLAMYVVAARRDLGDPVTIAEFVRDVRGREGLRDLYLLTVADLSTTSPSAMTKWKAGMLDALFRASDAMLAGTTGALQRRVAHVRDQVRWLCRTRCDPSAVDEYLEAMPERYLLANTPAEIAAHAALATAPRSAPVVAALVPSSHRGVLELCVVTNGRARAGLCVVASDKPGLLASISAAISASRLEIQAAQVHSRALSDGGFQAVDLFWVQATGEDGAALSERLRKLEADLRAVVTGQVEARELVKPSGGNVRHMRVLPSVFTEVLIDHRASDDHTVIEVLTEDRPALLFHLAEALHGLGLTISVAKIATEGTRVIDVFYVTEATGAKLTPGRRSEEVRQQLMNTLRSARNDVLTAS